MNRRRTAYRANYAVAIAEKKVQQKETGKLGQLSDVPESFDQASPRQSEVCSEGRQRGARVRAETEKCEQGKGKPPDSDDD